MLRRLLVACLPLVAGCLVFTAQPARGAPVQKVAVVAAFGDSLSVVTYEPVTGSRVARNRTQPVAVPDRSFDAYAADSAVTVLRKSTPQWQAFTAIVDTVTGATVESLRKGNRVQFPEEAARALAQEGVTHVVLITRFRAPAALKVELGTVGSGALEGIGFYIDRSMPLKRSDTEEIGIGFLAPFAYLQLSLVDLASGEIARTAHATETTSFSGTSGESGHPWDALDAKAKVAALNAQIRAAVEKAATALAGAN